MLIKRNTRDAVIDYVHSELPPFGEVLITTDGTFYYIQHPGPFVVRHINRHRLLYDGRVDYLTSNHLKTND